MLRTVAILFPQKRSKLRPSPRLTLRQRRALSHGLIMVRVVWGTGARVQDHCLRCVFFSVTSLLPPTHPQAVTLHTTLGDIKLELACDAAPAACANFLAHAAAGTYDGTCFHRSVPRFVLQGGDPTGTGKGGSALLDSPTFLDEAVLKHDAPGVVSVANGIPSRGLGSQFMLTYAPAPSLDGKHVAFGRVIDGLDVLGAAERVPTGDKGRPVVDVAIKSVTIHASPVAG